MYKTNTCMAERFRPIEIHDGKLVASDSPDLQAKRAANRARVAADKDSPKYHSTWKLEVRDYGTPRKGSR